MLLHQIFIIMFEWTSVLQDLQEGFAFISEYLILDVKLVMDDLSSLLLD